MDCESVRENMMDVLYGEGGAETARLVAEHQARCPRCREEMQAFRRLRRDLSAWTLEEGAPARTRRLPAAVPYLAWAASVLLAFGSAFALSGSEARLERGELSVRLGRARPAANTDVLALLSEQEARHQREVAELRGSLVATPASLDEQRLLQRVEDLVRESEARQAGRLDQRLADYAVRDAAQRRYDLARMSAGLSYLEGKTGRDVARTAELVSYVLQAQQQK